MEMITDIRQDIRGDSAADPVIRRPNWSIGANGVLMLKLPTTHVFGVMRGLYRRRSI